MIYDCFSFFNELDLLELRLNILNDVVDKFVLVESSKTHAGNSKPLYFQENKARFSKFLPKIISIVADDFPPFESSWTYENYQRNCIAQGLNQAQPSDAILISDLDEIPNPKVIKKYAGTKGIKLLEQKMFYYFFNCKNFLAPTWFLGTKMLSYQEFLSSTSRPIEYSDFLLESVNQGATASKIRSLKPDKIIRNAGWHFSFLGGVDAILKKIQAFSHQEFNAPQYTNRDYIQHCLETGTDIFKRGDFYAPVAIDKSFPQYLRENLAHYQKFVCPLRIKPFSRIYFKCLFYTLLGQAMLFTYFYLTPPFIRPLLHKLKAKLIHRPTSPKPTHNTAK